MTTNELDRTALAALNIISQQVLDGQISGSEARRRLQLVQARVAQLRAEQRGTDTDIEPNTAFVLAFVEAVR